MTRILLVVDDATSGGTFKVAERLAAGLAPRFAVCLACCFTEVNAAARRRLAALGVVVLRHHHDSARPSRSSHDRLGAEILIAGADPDAILFCDSTFWSSLATKAVARARALPHVAIVNLFEAEAPAALRRWDDEALRAAAAAAAVVFVSQANLALFRARFPDAEIRARVVPNGVPDVFFRAPDPSAPDPSARDALRRDLGLDRDATMLLLVGRLEGRKGQILAVRALDRLRRRIDAAAIHLFLVGFGPDHQIAALRREIAALDLEPNVHLLGARDDVPALLDACDLVLFPSHGEGDPLVTKEAMASGRAVIASDLPEIREQGLPPALLVRPPTEAPEATIEDLAAALEDLCRHPERREAYGRELRRTAERRFREGGTIAAYADLIDGLPIAPRDPAPRRPVVVPGIALGRRLNLADPAEAWRVLHGGWDELEPEGTWSLGDTSTIVVRTETRIRAARITLVLQGLVVPGRAQVTEVTVDGIPAGTWRIASGRRTRRSITVAFRVPKRCFVVRLRHRGAITPRELGLGDDGRRLALFVSSLTITKPLAAALFDRLAHLVPTGRVGRTQVRTSSPSDADAPGTPFAVARPVARPIATRLGRVWRFCLLRAVCDAAGRVRPLFAPTLSHPVRRRLEAEHAYRWGGAAPTCDRAADVVARLADLDPALAGLEASLRGGRVPVVADARCDPATRLWGEIDADLTGLPDRLAFVATPATEIEPSDGATLVVATDDPDAISATWITRDGRSEVFAHPATGLSLDRRAEVVSWLIQALRPDEVVGIDSRALDAATAAHGAGLSALGRSDDPIDAPKVDPPSEAATLDVTVVVIAHEEGDLAVASLRGVARAVATAERAGVSTEVVVVLDRPDAATIAVVSATAPADWRVATVDFGDPGSSRNAGARLARGRWIAHVDADDLCDPRWLVDAFRAAESEPRLAVWHPELNVYFGEAVHVWRHVDMDDPSFDPAVLVHTNCWTALCFAPRALLLAEPYRATDQERRFGYEDWTWNRDVLDRGAVHRIVPGTGHLIRVKPTGSVFRRSQAMRFIPHPTDLFRHRIAARRLRVPPPAEV